MVKEQWGGLHFPTVTAMTFLIFPEVCIHVNLPGSGQQQPSGWGLEAGMAR